MRKKCGRSCYTTSTSKIILYPKVMLNLLIHHFGRDLIMHVNDEFLEEVLSYLVMGREHGFGKILGLGHAHVSP
jgi:hypothetical protein